MVFVPPHFKDLGKKAKDVLSKKYDYKNELKTINKAEDGVTLEAGSAFTKGIDTYLKGTYKHSSFGTVEAEIHTAARPADTKAKVTLNQLAAGVTVALTGDSALGLGLEADYTRDMAAVKLVVKQSDKGLGTNLAAAFGLDGKSVGFTACLDGNFGLKALDFGSEYRHGKIVAALGTSGNQSKVNFSVFNPVCSSLTMGVALGYGLADSKLGLSVGSEYALDKATSVKVKASEAGIISLAVEHKLDIMKFSASADLDSFDLGAPAKKFGISCVFGDY